MNQFDTGKFCLYIAALLGGITVGLLQTVLRPWGLDDATINGLSLKILSASIVLAFIGNALNTLKNRSPDPGMVSVTAPKDAPLPLKAKDLSTAPPPSDPPGGSA